MHWLHACPVPHVRAQAGDLSSRSFFASVREPFATDCQLKVWTKFEGNNRSREQNLSQKKAQTGRDICQQLQMSKFAEFDLVLVMMVYSETYSETPGL